MNIPMPKHVIDCEGEGSSQHGPVSGIRVLGECGVTPPRDFTAASASHPLIVAGEGHYV